MTCSLAFSSLASTSFDSNIKEWRLFADIINDVGLLLGGACIVSLKKMTCHCGLEGRGMGS